MCLTSVNAVDSVAEALRGDEQLDARALGEFVIGAVGRVTASYMTERLGVKPDLVGPGSAAGFAELTSSLQGASALYPASDRADDGLGRALARQGIATAQVVSYSIVDRQLSSPQAARVTSADAVVIASPSAAASLATSIDPALWPSVVVLGERSARAVRAVGREVTVASEASVAGVVAALASLRPAQGTAARDS